MKIEFLFYNIVSIIKFIQCEMSHLYKMKAICFMDITDFFEVTHSGNSTLLNMTLWHWQRAPHRLKDHSACIFSVVMECLMVLID
jgi:hypothetical protein